MASNKANHERYRTESQSKRAAIAMEEQSAVLNCLIQCGSEWVPPLLSQAVWRVLGKADIQNQADKEACLGEEEEEEE